MPAHPTIPYPWPLPWPTSAGGRARHPPGAPPAARTCVDPIVGLQLVLEAELLAAAVALVGLLAGVDALVALQRALVPEAAAAELALVGVVACKHTHASGPPRRNAPRPAFTPGARRRHPGGRSVPAAPARHAGSPAEGALGSAAARTRPEGSATLPLPIPGLFTRPHRHRPGPGRLPCSRPGG